MAAWTEQTITDLSRKGRIDAEYFQPHYLAYDNAILSQPYLTLGDIAFVTDGLHASPDVVEEGGIRYLSAKCVKDNDFAVGNTIQISALQDKLNKRTQLQVDDLLLTTVGTIGNAAVVQRELVPANIDRHVGLIRIQSGAGIDPYYAATFLNSKYGRFQTLREATGNVQLNLFIEKIKTLKISVLPNSGDISDMTRRAYELRRKSLEKIEQASATLASKLGFPDQEGQTDLCYQESFSQLRAARRFGAEYFMPCKRRTLQLLRSASSSTIGHHFQSVRELFDPRYAARAGYVRNFDVTDALEPVLDDQAEPVEISDVGSTKKSFRGGDVLISRLRSYLRQITLARTSDELPSVGSSEFIVLRPSAANGISPEALLVFLRSMPVQTILRWSQDGSQHPRFTEADLLAIPAPNVLIQFSSDLTKIINNGLALRAEAAALLAGAKNKIEEQLGKA